MLTIETPPQYLDIIQHDNHFYEFIFKKGSPPRNAFDDWLMYVEKLYQLPPETPVKLLTDTRQIASIPLSYAFRKAQPVMKNNPIRPKIRSAFISPESQGVLEKLVQSFMQLLSVGDEIRYFYGDKRDEAIAWLFINEPEHAPDKS